VAMDLCCWSPIARREQSNCQTIQVKKILLVDDV
jgi:hypothetical protein